MLGIVGESGSGKTVSALALLGLQPGKITRGTAHFRSEKFGTVDLFSCDTRTLHGIRGKEIAYVFQEPGMALNPVIRCGKQLEEVIHTHFSISRSEAKNECLKWLNKVGFENAEQIYARFPHELSGGQKQRIMLAIAMAPLPRLLLADEPSTALDADTQDLIISLIQKLCSEQQTALLFISHNLELTAKLSQQLCVMQNGKMVESGTAERIFQSPENPFTKKLIESSLHLTRNPISQEKEVIVQVESLSAGYGSSSLFKKTAHQGVIDSLSFSIHKGETLGLMGKSGSGKSTLASILMALKSPDAGRVHLFGKNLFELNDSELRKFRKRFRIIFQDPYASLNPKISIGKQLEEAFDGKGNKKDTIKHWLEKVSLKAGDAEKLPEQFSGGQRQRIAIARALISQPEFLICDECVSSLDRSLQREILDLLLQLQAETGLTMLFISHEPAVLRYMCNRILVLENGRIKKIVNPAELV